MIIGVGNVDRGDDAAGILVVRRLKERVDVPVLENGGDLLALLDQWEGEPRVIVVDATRSGSHPGTVHRLEAHARPLDFHGNETSSHAVGLAQAIELARTLDRLPAWIVVYGIEAGHVDFGGPLSPAVAAAVEEVAARIEAEIRAT